MAKNRIVILGARGMLGSDLALLCRQNQLDTTLLDLPEFDITNTQHLRDALKDCNVVINCAAYTNVDGAETQTQLAHKVNAEALGTLGSIARQAGIWVLHISTDFVFDGKSDKPYTETDPPNPINAYGKSKLAGEQLLIDSTPNHCIMRVEWTYGHSGNNFVTKLVSIAKQNKNLKVVDDQKGSPTATVEAARVICELVDKKPQGLFHFASAGYTTRFEMAKFIFDKLNIPVDLTNCPSTDYPSPAQRPLNSCFDCTKISSLLDNPIERWEKPLEHFLRQL